MIKLLKKTYTKNNNPVELFVTENNPEKSKTILIIGVFHGDEPEGEVLINRLMAELAIAASHPADTPRNNSCVENNKVLFIPCLCPDGKELNTRTNANGVDLNRNFPTKNRKLPKKKDSYYPGKFPASEPETKFLIEILEEYKPSRILTIHAPYKVVNYDGPAKELAEEMSKLNGYPVQKDIGYPTPGSFGTYAGIERNIPVITLELPENECLEKLWEDNKEAFYYFIK